MKVIYNKIDDFNSKEGPNSKTYKLSKDRAAISAGVIKWTLEMNEKIRKQKTTLQRKRKDVLFE